ncbi:MAG TPA: M48 family metalloprotease [Gaiellaceae bacterium]|nr:M48 family metalloprotease [Gaiellaceae bacterium]
MTATRIGVATLTAVALGLALVLWRTSVPDDLPLPHVEPTAYFTPAQLHVRAHHDVVLRWLGLGTMAAQLVALLALARRPPPVRGHAVLRAAQLGALAAVALFLARLPFGVAVLWWQRRSDIARVGYGQWLLDGLPGLAERAALFALAAALCIALARRVDRRWWLGAAPAFAALGVVVTLAQPLLTPRLAPLQRPRLVGEIQAVGREQGLDHVDVQVQRVHERTRQLNAEALGIGPTTRVILWDTTLRLPPREIRFLAGHELGHVSRKHLWKGLAWFVLLVVPSTWLLARVVPLRGPEEVPRAVLAGVAILFALTPFTNAISRRYEAEADWVGLETTRDPRAAKRFFVDLSAAGLRTPNPPRWSVIVFGSHPSLTDRIAMAEAWARSRRAAAPRAGS